MDKIDSPIVPIEPELSAALADSFHLSPLRRGWKIEKLLKAGDLSPNYPCFDRTRYLGSGRFEFASIKSRDLRAARYRSLACFARTTRRDIDVVANVERIPQWRYTEQKMSLIPFDRSLGGRFVLEVVVCGVQLHANFMSVLAELSDHAAARDVVLRVFSV